MDLHIAFGYGVEQFPSKISRSVGAAHMKKRSRRGEEIL
jgi:hypothetical protein